MTDSTQQAEEPAHEGATERPGVAAFDFDGTLARRDTMVPFLLRTHGWHRVVAATGLTCVRIRERDALKVAVVGRLFRGMPATRLQELGHAYAQTLPDLLRPELVERVQWHKQEGHAVVVVSAGLTAYLEPLGDHLELDHVMGVELHADEQGVLTGQVIGGVNNRGPAKVARLRSWIDAHYGPGTEVELWAYGDSSGDEDLLAQADHPTWVGRRAG
jgi:phosphatidylglycerophosphatase C